MNIFRRVRASQSLWVYLMLGSLLALCACLALVVLPPLLSSLGSEPAYPEVAELASGEWDFNELSEYYTVLAETKGAAYAFEVMKRMPTIPNIDMHLLGHVVGGELYKQEGIEGIQTCTEDFRNACSHMIVIGALLEQGVSALSDIARACQQAPGGAGAYTMCYHGLGHGVLAFTEYEMPEAVELCKKTGTAQYHNREYIECVGGVIMEMIGGVHDPALRVTKSEKYFKVDDPLYPCNASFMPKEARQICYVYITPHLFEAAGGDLAAPTPDIFEKAFDYCAEIPEEQKENRMACYSGFGKEFVVLGAARDIRVVDVLPDAQLSQIHSWCQLAGDAEDTQACSASVLASLYWGGENKADGVVRYCALMSDGPLQDHCFTTTFNMVASYAPDEAPRDFCPLLPESRQDACLAFFASSP
jgi:hypothetical protein